MKVKSTLVVGGLLMAGFATGTEVHTKADVTDTTNGLLWDASKWDYAETPAIHPDPGIDYVVDHKNGQTAYIRFGDDSKGAFAGKSLRFGSSDGWSCAAVAAVSSFQVSGEGGLILEKGSVRNWTANTQGTATTTLGGKVTVTSTSASPFWFAGDRTKHVWKLTGTLHGTSEAYLRTKANPTSAAVNEFTELHLLGSAENYLGTIELVDVIQTSTLFLAGDFGGTIMLPSRGILAFSTVTTTPQTVQNLTLAEGAKIDYAFSNGQMNHLIVSGTLTKPANGKICLGMPDFMPNLPRQEEGWSCPILSIPSNSGLGPADFAFVGSDEKALAAAGVRVSWAEDENGRPTLTLARDPIDYLTGADTTDGSFTGAGKWKSGNPPSGDVVYLAISQMRTPVAMKDGVSGEATWAGGLLVSSREFVLLSRKQTVTNMTCNGGSINSWAQSASALSDSRIYARQSTMWLCGDWLYVTSNGLTVQFNSVDLAGVIETSLRGPGDITFNALAQDKNAYLELMGDNADWTGKLIPSIKFDATARPSPRLTNTGWFRIAQASSLGGARTDFAYDALTLSSGTILWPHPNKITLATANRGILVLGKLGGIRVDADDVFTVNEPITLGANLHKLDAGRLVLGGGAMRFCTDASPAPTDNPTTGYDLLSVDAGELEVASSDAVNGAVLSFAKDAKLVVRAPREDDADEFKTYGFRNTKTQTPFMLGNGVEKIPVALDLASVPEKGFDIPVVTVKTEVADDVARMLQTEKIRGFRVTLVPQPNEDGTTTLRAVGERQGLMLLFK